MSWNMNKKLGVEYRFAEQAMASSAENLEWNTST